ncbi:MAG TPA: hypothetical protein VH575_34115 [Gemmataceae bacterium]|jgi:hypothetical protein
MTEQELIQALRELIAKASSDAPDPRLLAREISRRDQWRIPLLASLSLFFWLLAAAGLVLLCVGLDRFVIWVRISDAYPVVQPNVTDKPAPKAPHFSPLSERERQLLYGTNLIHHTIWVVAGSAVSMFLGALCTVLLITTSRRATLGQINLSLMELSEQLRQLRSANLTERVRKPENP